MNGQSPVSSSEILGELTGGLICSLVLVFAIWKCWRNVRTPGTNRKCALALLFFFLTVSIPAGAVTASWFLRAPPPAGILSVLMGLGMFGLWIAAIVLAVIGLVEMSLKPGVWDYGRNQAIWALALCVILGVLAVKSMHRKSRTIAFGTIEPGQLLRFEDEKFEFLAPGRPWVSVDPAKINREARLAFRRSGPEAIFWSSLTKPATGPSFPRKNARPSARNESKRWRAEPCGSSTKSRSNSAASRANLTNWQRDWARTRFTTNYGAPSPTESVTSWLAGVWTRIER